MTKRSGYEERLCTKKRRGNKRREIRTETDAGIISIKLPSREMQMQEKNIASSLFGINCSDREHIFARCNLSGHQEAQLTHALSTLAGLRTLLVAETLTSAVAHLFLQLFLSPLATLLQALDNVDGAADVLASPIRVGGLATPTMMMMGLAVAEDGGSPR